MSAMKGAEQRVRNGTPGVFVDDVVIAAPCG
jgi:hypothetical protein